MKKPIVSPLRFIFLTIVAALATFGSTSARQSDVPAAVRFTYGGDGVDTVNAVTTDAVGNIYIAGRTTSRNLPGTERGFQKTGAIDRSTTAAAIAVGRNGDAWVLASTTSPQFPWTHDVSGGAGGAYLGHVLANGTLASWTRLGSGSDLIAGLSLDRLGRPNLGHSNQN